ncbi:SDR family NAD(P)-dependent oxidoreductase [Serinicoccus kebangsaanensis]|uniref:SDR family NAD(P)-dependent oxidoreductase n=1 Tax=Serinicoccus kebangsaanensis TaxID=2602069 RepID=UPI00124EB79B|nr:SDR family oxidoreductase [Serinicoccus kebangsaanensis]
MQISHQTFVVTGAGNGIGREIALELLRREARVAAVDVREESLQETARLAGAGDRVSVHTVDITDRDAVQALPGEVIAHHGHLDGLLNVAGIIQEFVPFMELSGEAMRRVLDVNLWGTIHTAQACLPHLVERPEACLVNVSSMGGFVPVPGQTIYGASKAAVRLLTEGLYAELRGTAVAVSVVFPGAIGTDITTNSGVASPGGGGQERAESGAHRTLPPARAARIIVDEAVVKGRYRVTVGSDAAMLDRLSRVAPQRATDLIARRMGDLLG